MATVFLGAVFKPLFKIAHDTGQQLTINRTNFLTDGFLQIIQHTGFLSVNTRFQIPPKEKNHTLKDQESEGATARLRNGKWGAWETCFERWSLTRCSTGQVSIATEVINQEGKNTDHLVPPLGLPTEYYSFKRCQVPMGHPVLCVFLCYMFCGCTKCIVGLGISFNLVFLPCTLWFHKKLLVQ